MRPSTIVALLFLAVCLVLVGALFLFREDGLRRDQARADEETARWATLARESPCTLFAQLGPRAFSVRCPAGTERFHMRGTAVHHCRRIGHGEPGDACLVMFWSGAVTPPTSLPMTDAQATARCTTWSNRNREFLDGDGPC